jgi:hypothetical protein
LECQGSGSSLSNQCIEAITNKAGITVKALANGENIPDIIIEGIANRPQITTGMLNHGGNTVSLERILVCSVQRKPSHQR